MTAPEAGRGGTPPRLAGPPGQPQQAQWFIFGPWLYDIQAALQMGYSPTGPAVTESLPPAVGVTSTGRIKEFRVA